MKLAILFSLFPLLSLAYSPTPLRAVDGRDLSFLLKRYDGPLPILRRAVKGRRHAVPRTLQVEVVPVRRALTGLVVRQQCVDAGYLPCPGGTQCCPAGDICGIGSCCPAGDLSCAGNCCQAGSGDCCANVGCCPGGQVCFTALDGEIGCCPIGQHCTTISGCADPTATQCPGETFCCIAGTTCSRDATGNASCVNSSGLTVTVANPGPAPTVTTVHPPTVTVTTQNGNPNTGVNTVEANPQTNPQTNNQPTTTTASSNNPLANLDPFKKSAASSRVAGASGLVVAVALLGAVLVL